MLRMIVAMGLTRWRYIGLWASILLTVAILLVNDLTLGLDFTGGDPAGVSYPDPERGP